ncbi:heterokaryon incompatibility protein-domain-containing protein [Colletotrichum navitas]|uniref:Heterokaryon incompatibility protein-domain-containing protein n=1 Tax=Colletotrichum navitas TaxID=681940 RepID=A0AAD8Q674_9PEZI|nr:heterokaryon incompatibility protein-domain-containing protein [Colletotrichum navitas]KAK1596663.1 heterokaryon incompatibility protein-domain-containing protein [Colletotrichum navitas]
MSTSQNKIPSTASGHVKNVHTQVSSSVYPALPLNAGDVRIISIKPSDECENKKVCCTLEVASLKEGVVSYLAVSYTWGPASVNERTTPPTPITCNGQDILVPHNLEKALLRIRSRPEFAGKKFWIDAISINQTDDEERSSQVKLMAAIYSSADSVLIWLGEEDDDTSQAFDLINLFPTIDQARLEELTPHRVMQSKIARVWGGLTLHDLLYDPASWNAVRRLFRRTYFHRVWIIQEVVLAKNAIVLCGSHATSWGHLEALSHFLSTSSWSSHFSALSLDDPSPGPCHHTTPAVLKANKVSRREERYAEALTSSLVRCRHFKATDPRDKVYALLGLVGLGGKVIDKPGLQPVYGSRTVESAYISAATQILKDSDDLLLLYCIEGEAFQYSPELPSWVPDWRCEKALGLRVTRYRRFNASGGLARRLVVHESSRILEVRARRVDVILSAGEAKHEINKGEPFPKLMKILKGNNSCIDEATLNMVWRSLLTNTGGDPPQCPIDESYRGAFVHWFTDKLSVLTKSTPVRETKENEAILAGFQQLSKQIPPSPSKEHYDTVFSHAVHLKLFKTLKGYIGAGSESLQEDDSVWIVPGSRVPLIFRKDGPDHHRLVGGAYVHGLMHGEALELDGVTNQWEALCIS